MQESNLYFYNYQNLYNARDLAINFQLSQPNGSPALKRKIENTLSTKQTTPKLPKKIIGNLSAFTI